MKDLNVSYGSRREKTEKKTKTVRRWFSEHRRPTHVVPVDKRQGGAPGDTKEVQFRPPKDPAHAAFKERPNRDYFLENTMLPPPQCSILSFSEVILVVLLCRDVAKPETPLELGLFIVIFGG